MRTLREEWAAAADSIAELEARAATLRTRFYATDDPYVRDGEVKPTWDHAIANPLMLHIPTADGFVDAEAQKAMHAGLDDHPRVTLYDYPGLDHGFATQFGNRRDEQGAQLADARTDAFFAEHLA